MHNRSSPAPYSTGYNIGITNRITYIMLLRHHYRRESTFSDLLHIFTADYIHCRERLKRLMIAMPDSVLVEKESQII